MEMRVVLCVCIALLVVLPGNDGKEGRGGGMEGRRGRGLRMPGCKTFEDGFKGQMMKMVKSDKAQFRSCRGMDQGKERDDCTFENMMKVKSQMEMMAPQACMDQVNMIYMEQSGGGTNGESESP